MKQLRLDNMREVTITDKAYEQIIAIVNANRICGKCRRPYDKTLPQVSENLCLECFQKKYEGKCLTYVGLERINEQGDETHLFLDTRGNVYYTATSSDHEPYESNFATLQYWDFPVPEYVMRDEKQVELNTWEWYIYDAYIFEGVAEIASSEYDAALKGEQTNPDAQEK